MGSADFRPGNSDERAMRAQRRLTLWSAAAMVPFFAEDAINGGPHVAWSVGIKIGWAVALVGIGLSLPRASPRARSRRMAVAAFWCGVGMAGIAALRGGHDTPFFAWLFALPLCVAAMVRDDVRATVAAGVPTVGGAIAMLIRDGVGGVVLGQWVLCVVSSAVVALYASLHLRAHRRDEAQLERERMAALEQLAESEKRNAHAQRMASIGTLAAGVAHEINNPLAAVSSNLVFLEEEVNASTLDRAEVGLVILEAQVAISRIKNIVGDLAAFSREATPGNTEVDLQAVVDEAEKMAALRTGHQIGIQSVLPRNLRVMGNHRHLAQVFLNLLINAADAINETSRTDGQIWIRASNQGEAVTIDVDDNGPGLSEGVMKGLFVPFFTTRAPRRTGLGLATSREYLRRAGGDLTAAPRPEGGARFTIALRAAP